MIYKMPVTKEEFITATQIHWREIIRILNTKRDLPPMAIKKIALKNVSKVFPVNDCFSCHYDRSLPGEECSNCLLTPGAVFCLNGAYSTYLDHVLSFRWKKAANVARSILELTNDI